MGEGKWEAMGEGGEKETGGEGTKGRERERERWANACLASPPLKALIFV